jgi:hypothetical protein
VLTYKEKISLTDVEVLQACDEYLTKKVELEDKTHIEIGIDINLEGDIVEYNGDGYVF